MASGDTLLIFQVTDNVPPTTNYATLDTINLHPVLDFDKDISESAVFGGVMPQHYGGGGVAVYLHWCSDVTSGDADWDVSWERIGDQQLDIDADSFAAVNSVDGTAVPGTSHLVDIVSVAFTDGADMDSVAAGEAFRLKVARDVADTAAGDNILVAVEIRET